MRREIYEQHPDWASRTADGGVINYNGDVHVCVNSGFQQECQFEIIRELLTTHKFDGIFYNMSGFQMRDYSFYDHGLCHCENCKRRFREMFGLEIPDRADMNDPAYRKYRVFTRACDEEHEEALVRFVRSLGGQFALNGRDYQRVESNTDLVRDLPMWQYSASSNTRCATGPGQKRPSDNASVDFIGFCYRHVAVSPHEQELRLWQNLANRGGLSYYVIGRLDTHLDHSGYEAVQKVFVFHEAHEDVLFGLRSAAHVLVLRSALWAEEPETRGWIRALTENHIPFDEFLLSELTDEKQLSRYDLIILGNLKYISGAHANLIDAFANGGGTVLATGESAFGDEQFEERGCCALSCLGIELSVPVEGKVASVTTLRGGEVRWTQTDDEISISLNRLTDYEGIVCRYE